MLHVPGVRAYAAGMSRLSCVFCIMASRADLYTAAQLQPALYRRYVSLEERIGHTLSPSGVPLSDRPASPVSGLPILARVTSRKRQTLELPSLD